MNNQQQKKIIYAVLGLIVLLAVFYIGYNDGKVSTFKSMSIGGSSDLSKQFEPFWKVWNTINDKFVTATTTSADTQDRIYGAIKGLASSQNDPYTVFFPPEENTAFKDDIAGNFQGVGMEIGIKNSILTVVAPIKGSPADIAGVKTGDQIIKIDGTSTSELTVDKAVKLIRGEKGTTVKIVFLREGSSQPLEKSIIRDVIDIPTLETKTTTDVFTIKLFSFTAQSPDLFRNALRQFLESGDHKLIIDLRGNPGGYLDAAWDIASWFLPAGKTVVTEDFGGKGENNIYKSKGYDVLNKFFGDNYKVVVLVDNGSASAAEILAGALKENNVAKLVGLKTFGKGSVQELVPITDDTSLKITIARWLTPSGHNLSHDGLDPDYKVEISQKDIDAKVDPQFNKAVEILEN